MAHSQEVRDAVRRSYVYERLPLEAAAEKHEVKFPTARGWKKKAKESGDDWDKARSASRMADGGLGDITNQLLEDFTLLFQSTVEDITNGQYDGLKKAAALSQLSDAYTKTMNAATKGNPKLAKLSVAMEMLEELTKFIKQHDPDLLPAFAAILEPFGKRITEVFG